MKKTNIVLITVLIVAVLVVSVLLIATKNSQNATPTVSNTTSTSPTETTTTTSPTAPTTLQKASVFTLSDVAKHSSESDCWMAINGSVYNVTSYISDHPGGQQIIAGCGKDASSLFESVRKHMRGAATNVLTELLIGKLQ